MSLYKQVLSDAPLVYWPFDEAVDGATAKDASGNNRNATDNGTGASLGATSVVPGLPYSSFQNGSGYWSRVDEAAFQVGTGDFTYECWMVCTNPTSDYVQVFGRDAAATGNGQILYLETGTGYPRIYTAGASHVLGTLRLSDSKLHHVVYRRISGVHSVVVDAVQQGSASAAGSVINSALRVFTLDGTAQFFQGRMAHFAYYNVGLSDARIKAHYEAGIRSGVVAGPGAYGGSAYGTVAYGGGTGAENTTPLVFTEASLSLTATGDLTASSAQFAMHDANLVFNAVATVGLDARPIHEARLVLHG